MVATATRETSTIDRSACPSTGGHGTRHYRERRGCTCRDSLEDTRRSKGKRKLPPGAPAPDPLVSSAGTARRLQAAAVVGYGAAYLAPLLYCTPQRVQQLRAPAGAQVFVEVAERVAVVVEDLLRKPAPQDRPGSKTYTWHQRTRDQAAAAGWHPLDAWADIDDPADVPDSAYRRADDATTLTLEDIRFLMSEIGGGHDADEIGRMYGLDGESVARRLARANSGTPHALTDDQIHALRAEYVRDPDGWDLGEVAQRYGTTKSTISQLVRGRRRADLGLTDLAAHKRSHTPAATPTRGTNREEGDAA